MSNPAPETGDFSLAADNKKELMARVSSLGGDLTGIESNPNYANTASDWVAPRKPGRVIQSKNPRVKSSVSALKTFTNDKNLTTNWFGKDLGSEGATDGRDKFWVPSKSAIDSADMRMLACKEFTTSAVEYSDAEVFACGSLPSQYLPSKSGNAGVLHPPDLVDATSAKSLVQTSRGKGEEVKSWDGTVRDTVSAKLWRLRESVK